MENSKWPHRQSIIILTIVSFVGCSAWLKTKSSQESIEAIKCCRQVSQKSVFKKTNNLSVCDSLIWNWKNKVVEDNIIYYRFVKKNSTFYLACSSFKNSTGLGANFFSWAFLANGKLVEFESLSNNINQVFVQNDSISNVLIQTIEYGDRFFRYRIKDSLDFKIKHYEIDTQKGSKRVVQEYNSDCSCSL